MADKRATYARDTVLGEPIHDIQHNLSGYTDTHSRVQRVGRQLILLDEPRSAYRLREVLATEISTIHTLMIPSCIVND